MLFRSCVTFSGLLNAIDGLQDPKGILFIFTSNHPERLDPALRRKGRIDIEFALERSNKEQIMAMLKRFYPDASKKQQQVFADNVFMNGQTVTAASLQEFFVRNRKSSLDTVCNAPDFEGEVTETIHGIWS